MKKIINLFWPVDYFFRVLSEYFFKRKLKIILEALSKRHVVVPNILIQTLITAEDHRFYQHRGIDYIGVVRAALKRLGGKIQGASTIEQQFIRTVTGDYRRSFLRKIPEMILARSLISFSAKNIIACRYLQVAYFGFDMRGYKSGLRHLCRGESNPNPETAAELIARLKYPEPSSKGCKNTFQKILKRKNHILNLMIKERIRFKDISKALVFKS